jgi:hypothetical protein
MIKNHDSLDTQKLKNHIELHLNNYEHQSGGKHVLLE